MPCYQVRMTEVDFKVADHDLLVAAIESLGLKHTLLSSGRRLVYTKRNTAMEVGGEKAVIRPEDMAAFNELRAAYTRQTVYDVAKRNRMTIVEDEDDPNHLTLRSYG